MPQGKENQTPHPVFDTESKGSSSKEDQLDTLRGTNKPFPRSKGR